jgi:hypothetical protein
VGAPQQRDIRESFEIALKKARDEKYKIDAWTLCIPVSLDAKTTKWWDKWKREQETEHGLSIDLWDETMLEGLVLAIDAEQVRAQYFGAPQRKAYPTLPLLSDVTYDEMTLWRVATPCKLREPRIAAKSRKQGQ